MPEPQWLIETTILVDAARGQPAATAWLAQLSQQRRRVSVVSVAELLAGCRNRREERRIDREMEGFQVLPLDAAASHSGLALYRRFRLSHGVGFFDCLIAATAIAHHP